MLHLCCEEKYIVHIKPVILVPQAVRRRFDKRIYIPLPDLKATQRMFKVLQLTLLHFFVASTKFNSAVSAPPCAATNELNPVQP
jgi:hypothetical protein